MSYQHIAVRPISPSLGAEIDGIDLARGIDDAVFAELHQAFLEHIVIVLRGQRITPTQQVAFTRRFGAPMRVPYVRHMDEHPDLIAVIKEAEERNVSVFGGDWHADFTSLAEPPAATVLYGRQIPPCGGDTLFANQYMAAAALSDGLRALLSGLRAMHAGRPYGQRPQVEGARMVRSIEISRGNPEADVERPHPVLRRHPHTGRRALFVNRIYTTRFEDMSEEESAPLLAYLYGVATRPEFSCRLRWDEGTLVVWDNRCSLHYAINDYDGHRREMHRATVAGEVPV